MFKLAKIINGGVNVPEPEIRPVDQEFDTASGSAAILLDGLLEFTCSELTPTHIIISDKHFGDHMVYCYKTTPNMVFETTIKGSPAGLRNGSVVAQHTTEAGVVCVTNNTQSNPTVTIYDLAGAKKSGDTVYVTFNS